jgi:hypothetical protein
MKPKTITAGRLLLCILIIGITLGLVSWDHKQQGNQYTPSINDTVPKKTTEKKIRDLDDEFEFDMSELKLNLDKMAAELKESMKQLDLEKMHLDLSKVMKDVDMDKMAKELKESLSKMNWDEMKVNLDRVKEVDMKKVMEEMKIAQESMAKLNTDDFKKQLEKIKEMNMDEVHLNLEKMQEELKKIGPNIREEMDKVKVEMEKAKVEMQEYKEFINGLDNDGLLDKKENYSIRHKDGELTVNGKKVSVDIYTKYRSFLEKHKAFKIEKNKDNYNIDND